MKKADYNNNHHHRRQQESKSTNHQLLSKQEMTKNSSSNSFWGTVSPFKKDASKGAQNHHRHQDEDHHEDVSPLLGEETEYLCAACRSSKIDSHLVSLKKLREKALRYTKQLDEIRTATKKREKELTTVMERLQMEMKNMVTVQKNLHAQVENVDQLSLKMNMRKNKLRRDELAFQHALKEKEIFVNCQMVKLQSQEAAIKHRRKELNEEKLRIEKLAYLIFKTDLSTMTYKEFHSRIGKMQNQLERKYRKIKVFEHYCQHKTLPRGMQLESITSMEDSLDPAVTPFKESSLWNHNHKKSADLIDSSTFFASDQMMSKDQLESSFMMNYNNRKAHVKNKRGVVGEKDDEDSSSENIYNNKNNKKCKEKESIVKKMSNFKAKTGRLSFFRSQQSSFNATLYGTDEGGSSSNNGSGKRLEDHHHHTGKPGGGQQDSSGVSLTTTKKSKSEQEGQIVREVTNNIRRLVMSAKETCSSAHRLLQTPIPCVEKCTEDKDHDYDEEEEEQEEEEENKENQQPSHQIYHNHRAALTGSSQSQPDEDFIPDEFNRDDDDDGDGDGESQDSFLTDIPDEELQESQLQLQQQQQQQSTNSDDGDEDGQEILDETEIIHRRISKLENSVYDNIPSTFRLGQKNNNHHNWSTVSKKSMSENDPLDDDDDEEEDGGDTDENGLCSIFRNSKNDDQDKKSSQSLIHPEKNKCVVPFKFKSWKKPTNHNHKDCDHNVKDDLDDDDEVEEEEEEEEVSENDLYHRPILNHNNNNMNHNKKKNILMRISSPPTTTITTTTTTTLRRNNNHNNSIQRRDYPGGEQQRFGHRGQSDIMGGRSTLTTTRRVNNDDGYEDDDDLVKNRLSKLPETTRNEIVFAIGQKALAQVAQAIDKVSHGDQMRALNHNNNITNQGSKVMHEGNYREENHHHHHHLLRGDRRPDPYLQMIRRGMNSLSTRKGPRKIPSHLKFGNFNMRHRNNRRCNNTFRSNNNTQQQQPPATYHSPEHQPSLLLSNTKSNHSNNIISHNNNQSTTDSLLHHQQSNSNNNSNNGEEPICNDFPDGNNYMVGIVAEKILGINLANPGAPRGQNHVTPKLSHSRAFRV